MKPEPLDEAAVRRKVRSGVSLLALRGGALKVVGLAGVFVLAHLLAPRSFGMMAIGFSILGLASALGDAGLGGAFIRQTSPPTRQELAALTALQATVAAAVAALVSGAAAITRSETLAVAAIMAWSLPLFTLRTPGGQRGGNERCVSCRPPPPDS
jgi:O-antigen/teichoic acid export membrane protein